MKIRSLIVGVPLLSISIPPSIASAAEVVVPGDFATIQDAIDAVGDGDVVWVEPGVYYENLFIGGKAITLASVAGPDVTILDGDAIDTVVTIVGRNQQELSSEVIGFTITNGAVSSGVAGGGVDIEASDPTIADCVIVDNVGMWGGGIAMRSALPVIRDSIVHGNSGGLGGGMSTHSSSPQILDTDITANVASSGGGLFSYLNSVPSLTRVNLSDNYASSWGGGITSYWYGWAFLRDVVISRNTTPGGGGGVHIQHSGEVSGKNLVVVENVAGAEGGAFSLTPYAQMSCTHCTIAYNTAVSGGGFATDSQAYRYNLRASIVWENQPASDFSTTQWASHIAYSALESEHPGTGNIVADPLFLAPAAGDFHLQANSPCIDYFASANQTFADFDGVLRPQGAGPDMGAFEHCPDGICVGPEPELDPIELIMTLIVEVEELNLQNGIANSLDAKLGAAERALDDVNQNNDRAAIGALRAFMNAVEAQTGVALTQQEANELIQSVQVITTLLLETA